MGHAKIHNIVALGITLFSLLLGNVVTFEFKVGGSAGWTAPADNSNPVVDYKQWAENNRFQIGDTLLFTYKGSNDSVLYVSKEDYDNCSTSNPIDKFTDGYSVFKFQHSGPHYFISGIKHNCLTRNEKIEVIVLADRSNNSSPTPNSPAPTDEKSPPPIDQPDIPPFNVASSTIASLVSSIGALLIANSYAM